MKIVIVGNGAFGKAMFHVLGQNTEDVTIAKRGERIEADIVVLCAPAQAIRDILQLIHFPTETKIIVNTSKGIEKESHAFPFQIVKNYFGNKIEYYSLMGPSFASEIIKNEPTLVNLGYLPSATHKETIKNLFQTDSFRVKLTQGVEVLEIASAMKNIYAIGCGIADGLGYGTNTKVTLLTLAIDEMQQYFYKATFTLSLDATAAMIGDLILTCSSEESRNYQFGTLLVNYETEDALKKIGSTVEGYMTLQSFPSFQSQSPVKLPLANLISTLVASEARDVRKLFEDFLKEA